MSKLIVWPYSFTLQITRLVEVYRLGLSASARLSGGLQQELGGIPVSLRWSTTPELGFPRRPFNVYRRLRTDIPASVIRNLLSSPVNVYGSTYLPFPTSTYGPMYLVEFQTTVPSGGYLDISGYDIYGNVIPSLEFQTSTGGVWLFASPSICGLRVSGNGTVNSVIGVGQDDYANLAGWQLIQVVGLPVKPAEISPAYDDSAMQGFRIAPTTGFVAAEERLAITHLLRLPTPNTGDPTFPLPAWPQSAVLPYLNNLRSADNLYPRIVRCLQNSVDANPTKMQSLYQETVNLDGIKQANLPGATADPTQPSQASLPIVSLSMLAVSTDSDAATALGYGTIDIPAFDVGSPDKPGEAFSSRQITARATSGGGGVYDYMVMAPFVLPFGLKLELAALSQIAAGPEVPANFNAQLLQSHAVLGRDTTAQVPVELNWLTPSNPQACALLVSRQPLQSAVLNTARPPAVMGYDPYLGLPPGSASSDTPPADLLPNFKDAAGTQPVDGTSTARYLAAGIDVFGQWSNWTEADVTLSAAPIAQPGLNNVTFKVGALPATGKVVPYSLVIEVIWNWADRSPGSIRITGQFVSPGTGLGPAYLAGLAMKNDAFPGQPLVLTWDYGANDPATVAPGAILPTIDASHSGTVELISDVSGITGNQVMQYRVTLDGFSLDYTGGDEIDLAIYATATEHIRPGKWSNPVDGNVPGPTPTYIGRVVKAMNPLPPVVNFTPPSINWTALPDAYNKARGILEWTSDASASGYMVWESTEGALLQLLSPGSPDPDPTEALVNRGATLKSLVAANYVKSLQSFSRLNTDPIVGSRTEVTLPGNASVLYAYMVSAVSSQNVEAPRPPQIAVFGVPQRMVPGQPRLRLRRLPLGSTGIQVIGLAVETGVVPAGYRVYRVRNHALAEDVGLMGPPKILESDPGWQPYTEVPLHGGTQAAGLAITDTGAMPSWYPYYYRVRAIGPNDPANGKYWGSSLPSQLQSEYCLPPNPPLIDSLSQSNGWGSALVEFITDLPIPASSLGAASVDLLQTVADPANPGRMMQKVLLTSASDAITVGTLALPKPWWLHHPFPPPPHPPLNHGPSFARSKPDAQGHWRLYVLVPYASADANTYTIRLTDPLSRISGTNL